MSQTPDQVVINALVQKLRPKQAPKNVQSNDHATESPRVSRPSDSEVLEKLFGEAGGQKWREIYGGNWSVYYESQSSADAAISHKLAFWTDRDGAQVERIMQGSGLVRDKWNSRRGGSTWLAAEIARAIENTPEGYAWRSQETAPCPKRVQHVGSRAENFPEAFQSSNRDGKSANGHKNGHGDEAPTNPLLAGRVLLGEAMVNGVEPPEELEPGLLLRGKIHHIFAAGGLGKTMLALWFVKRRIERGERVVYFDDENGQRTVSERLQDMGTDPAQVDEYLFYIPFQDLPLTVEGRYYYRAMLEEIEPSLIVFDSWISFLASAGLNESENTDIQAWCSTYTQTARALGIAAVLLDHVPHEGSRARGASRKRDEADVQWRLLKTQDFGRDTVGEITLHREKDRDAWLPPSVTFSVGGTEDGRLVFQRSAGTIEEPDPTGGLTPNGRKLLDVLRARFSLTGANASEWAKAAKLQRQAVYRVRDDLIRLGLVYQEGQRYYPVTRQDGGGETVTSDPKLQGPDVTPETGGTGQGVTSCNVGGVTPESGLTMGFEDDLYPRVTSCNTDTSDTPEKGVTPCNLPLKGVTGVTPPGTPPDEFCVQAIGEVGRSGSGPAQSLANYLEKPNPERLKYLTKAVLVARDRDPAGWERFAGTMRAVAENPENHPVGCPCPLCDVEVF